MEEVRDLVVLEQLVNALPEDIRVWVKERKPKTSEETSERADDHVQARKQDMSHGQGSRKNDKKPTSIPRCDTCGKMGHHTGIAGLGTNKYKTRGSKNRRREHQEHNLQEGGRKRCTM